MNEVEQDEFNRRVDIIAAHFPELKDIASFVKSFSIEEQDRVFAFYNFGVVDDESVRRTQVMRNWVMECASLDGLPEEMVQIEVAEYMLIMIRLNANRQIILS